MMKLLFATAIVLCLAAYATAYPVAPALSESDLEIELPLENGRLNVGTMLRRLCAEAGIQPGQAIEDLDWSLDVQSLAGRLQLRALDRLADGAVSTSVMSDRVVVTIDRDALARSIGEASRSFDQWLGKVTGRMSRQSERTLGATLVDASGRAIPFDQDIDGAKHAVVLVHGLDDPGFMWRDLIPALHAEGHKVIRFEYPNDGPIIESADLLAATLAQLRTRGFERVDIVAHSMGGLVARDALTRPAHYGGDGSAAKNPSLPAVDRLIMLGTPNHGSRWARLRAFAELREHLYRAWHGEQDWFSEFDADGGGEAGVDLLPDSDFLRRLNERPLASHTRHTIIAGQIGGEFAQAMDEFTQSAGRLAESPDAPDWLKQLFSSRNTDSANELLSEVMCELGDGCVTVESARLERVEDFTIVAGNHLSMIVNVGSHKGTDHVPPAIPIVLGRLARESEDQ
jgi:pimeloyl-ACP methyl ester carboxylesterase